MGAILFQELTPEINVTVAENSERHSMTPTYIHKLNLRVNMSYNMRHALNTIFCLLSVSYLVGELICCLHMRQLGRCRAVAAYLKVVRRRKSSRCEGTRAGEHERVIIPPLVRGGVGGLPREKSSGFPTMQGSNQPTQLQS